MTKAETLITYIFLNGFFIFLPVGKCYCNYSLYFYQDIPTVIGAENERRKQSSNSLEAACIHFVLLPVSNV